MHLRLLPHEAPQIRRRIDVDIAGGASGKAGGLVAAWAFPKELAEISFREHERLAEEHDGRQRWGWRYVTAGSWEGFGRRDEEEGVISTKARQKPKELDWIDEDGSRTTAYSHVASHNETAQVHPFLFTTSMLELAEGKGVKVVRGRIKEIHTDRGDRCAGDERVIGVTYIDNRDGNATRIRASHVIAAAGPWTPQILPFKAIPIVGGRAHSITIKPAQTNPLSAFLLFTTISATSDRYRCRDIIGEPEIFSRPDGEVYVSYSGDSEPLPSSVAEVEVDESICDAFLQQAGAISETLKSGIVTKRQACYRPNVSDSRSGLIVGEDETTKGLIIASGHTCWGISNAPGSAKAVSEIVNDGKIYCADLAILAPMNY